MPCGAATPAIRPTCSWWRAWSPRRSGTLSVWLTYLAGARLFHRTAGLLAAAIFGLAFLPIFYSHLALNDVPALAPVALSLYGIAGVLRNGSRRDYVLAGVGIGLAAATKYTGGITVVCLAGAFAADALAGGPLQSARRLLLALGCAVLAFAAANPYAVLDFTAFHDGVTLQQSLAGGSDPIKLGTTAASGTAYYVWTLTWGLGWAPALAALGGAVLLLARRWLAMALVLIPAPVLFIIFMGDQQRFFGRWLLPVFEIVALLAAYGTVELVRWLHRARRVPVLVAGAAATVVMLGQSVASVAHSRCRPLAAGHPQRHPALDGGPRARRRQGGRRAGGLGRLVPRHRPLAARDPQRGPLAGVEHRRHQRRRRRWPPPDRRAPVRARRRVRAHAAARAARRVHRPPATAGWSSARCRPGARSPSPRSPPRRSPTTPQLANHARLMYHVSPFVQRDRAIPFSFDWSIDYYPNQYSRPGPEMSVYRLTGGDCAAPGSDAGTPSG